VEVLDGRGRPLGCQRALQLLNADHLGHVAREERDAVSGSQLALPGVWPDLERLAQRLGHPPLADPRILLVDRWGRWQLEHPLLADDHRGCRAELRDVPLAPAHDEGDDAHGAAAGQTEPRTLVVEEPIRRGECLADRAGRPGREVVVVVTLDRLERLGRGTAKGRVAAGDLRQEEEAALGPHLGAGRRLAEADQVECVGGALLAGQQADAGGQAVAHRNPRDSSEGRRRARL
jgi:hypothetical protein